MGLGDKAASLGPRDANPMSDWASAPLAATSLNSMIRVRSSLVGLGTRLSEIEQC